MRNANVVLSRLCYCVKNICPRLDAVFDLNNTKTINTKVLWNFLIFVFEKTNKHDEGTQNIIFIIKQPEILDSLKRTTENGRKETVQNNLKFKLA